VDTTRTNSNVRVEAVHELRKIREDNVIGIIGRPFVRSPGFVGPWMRVFRQHLVVDYGRVTGAQAVTQDAGCSATDTVRLGIQDIVCCSFEASFLVFRLPFAPRAKEGFVSVGFLLVQSSAPIHLWASKRSRIVDRTSQDCSWGSC
jgi:hypothetical protein